jgi:hypothetical protein
MVIVLGRTTIGKLQLQWQAHCNDESGNWIEAYTRTRLYTVRSTYFQTGLRPRMRLPAAHYIPGPKCTCSAKPILDPLGLHVTSGCGKDGYRHQIHHIISLELVSLLRYSSFHTVREERNLFRTGRVDAMREQISQSRMQSPYLMILKGMLIRF